MALIVVTTLACAASVDGPREGAVPSPGCDHDDALLSDGERSIVVDGEQRPFDLALPDDRQGPLPVIVLLHPALAGKQGIDHLADMTTLGTQAGFVVVVPESLARPGLWDTQPDGDDMAAVLATLDVVRDNVCIDDARIHVAGMSQGALMAFQLACHHPDRVASVASVAGIARLPDCDRQRPLTVAFVHGSEDTTTALDGSLAPAVTMLVDAADYGPVPDVARAWAAHNGCEVEVTTRALTDNVEKFRHGCDKWQVRLYVLDGVAHDWPRHGDPSGVPGFDATEELLDFFAAVPPLAPPGPAS
ncbi:MAG: dienelactone hydrolase family protein [Acidimicrobiia bacterium]|nr:dienelactone hydrolase family protein [Acidimicrobiia bacterium]